MKVEKAFYAFASSQITEGMSVLEVGFSPGRGKEILPDLPYLDFRSVEEFLRKDGEFDVIVSFGAIERLWNGLEVAQVLKSKCKRLILCVPYFEKPGIWGPEHVLHRLTSRNFPNFDYRYIHSTGEVMSFPTSEDTNLLLMTWEKGKVYEKRERILCAIPTKNRYDVLYHCLQAVGMQTVKPDKVIIYDDGKREDMRENLIGRHVTRLMSSRDIDWEVVFTPGIGQHVAHQMSNTSGYDFVWRLDDDTVPEPDVLERLLAHMGPDVGGVGGAVFEPGKQIMGGSSKMDDFFLGGNVQWGPGQGIHEVDHLYSSFLYRAGIVNYKHNMTNVAFHEETIFSHRLRLAGYRLIADTGIRTYHFRASHGGCRNEDNRWAYDLDHKEFMQMAEEEWGIKVIHLGVGLGDCFMFKHIIPDLLKKHKTVVVGSCYNQALADTGVKLIPYECVKNVASENIYDWCSERNWKGTLIDAYREMYKL